jgi:hypothetical protein
MAPRDQPAAAAAMIEGWVAEVLFGAEEARRRRESVGGVGVQRSSSKE